MSREIRLLLYFFVGFLLSAVSVLSFAETIPATSSGQSVQQYQCGSTSSPWVTTQELQVACVAAGGEAYLGGTCYSDYAHGVSLNGAPNNCRGRNEVEYSCPSGQNWTLSGSNCTRPDCLTPQVRNVSTGLCTAPPCAIPENSEMPSTYGFPSPMPSGVKGCVDNCQVYSGGNGYTSNGFRYSKAYSYGTDCGGATTPLTETPTPEKTCQQKGMCAGPTAGSCIVCSVTSTEQKTTSTNTPTSGSPSTTTSTTTQTCTGAGSCSSTTTVSNSSGATTTNVAGAPSGNGKGTATSDGQGNFKLDLPTDYQRDVTGNETNKLLGEIKDKFTPDTSDDSPLSGATHSAASQTELDEKNNLFTQAATGATDPTSGNKSAWSAAMSSGWWEPITLAGCAPIQSVFAGKTWILDPCPTAAKISEIGAYAMWVALVIGGFVMLTGGRVQT